MNRGKLKMILDRPRHAQHVFIRAWEPKVIYSHTDTARKGFAAKNLASFRMHSQSFSGVQPDHTDICLLHCDLEYYINVLILILFTSFRYIVVHFFLLLLCLFSIKLELNLRPPVKKGSF